MGEEMHEGEASLGLRDRSPPPEGELPWSNRESLPWGHPWLLKAPIGRVFSPDSGSLLFPPQQGALLSYCHHPPPSEPSPGTRWGKEQGATPAVDSLAGDERSCCSMHLSFEAVWPGSWGSSGCSRGAVIAEAAFGVSMSLGFLSLSEMLYPHVSP